MLVVVAFFNPIEGRSTDADLIGRRKRNASAAADDQILIGPETRHQHATVGAQWADGTLLGSAITGTKLPAIVFNDSAPATQL